MDVKLYNADCLEKMKDIPDGSIDCVLADPPYGTTACKWDSILNLDAMWKQLKRIIVPNGAIGLFANQPYGAILVVSNLHMFRYRWIWDKIQGGSFQLAKLQPMNNAEEILIFSHGKCANGAKLLCRYYPQMLKHKTSVSGGSPTTSLLNKNSMVKLHTKRTTKYPTTIQRFSKPLNTPTTRFHPTQKPVPLMEYLIKTYTKENETVLDFCMGSGTTGVACRNTNRKFIGIELDEKYFAIAKNRIAGHRVVDVPDEEKKFVGFQFP